MKFMLASSIILLAAMIKSPAAPADPYNILWKQYEQSIKDDLPKDALVILNKILDTALGEQNGFQCLKAMDAIYKTEDDIDWQNGLNTAKRFLEMESHFSAPLARTFYLLYLRKNHSFLFDDDDEQVAEVDDLLVNIDNFITLYSQELQSSEPAPYSSLEWTGMSYFTPETALDLARATLLDILDPESDIYRRLLSDMIADCPQGSSSAIHLLYMQIKATCGSDTEEEKKQLRELSAKYRLNKASQEADLRLVEILFGEFEEQERPEEAQALEIKALCDKSLELFPKGDYVDQINNYLRQLERRSLGVSHSIQAYPGKTIPINLIYTNLKSVQIRLYRLGEQHTATEDTYVSEEEAKEWIKTAKLSYYSSYSGLRSPLAINQEKQINLSAQKAGYYLLKVSSRKDVHYSLLFVSELAVAKRSRNGVNEIYATDFLSGKPLKSIHINALFNKYRKPFTKEIDLDLDGFSPIFTNETYSNVLILPSSNNDSYTRPVSLNKPYYNSGGEANYKNSIFVTIFTDRKLYQSGEKVYYKGIVYRLADGLPQVAVDYKDTLKIYAPFSAKTLLEIPCVTNRFGSFNGSFTLPTSGLNGIYSISMIGGRGDFRVENTVRPSFEMEIPEITGAYSYGDTIVQTGILRHNAGFALTGGTIRYTLHQSPLWRFYGESFDDAILDSGQVQTDSQGQFAIPVCLSVPKGKDPSRCYSHYILKITATDSQGESRETSCFYSAFNVPYVLSNNLSECILKEDQVKVKLNILNLNDVVQPLEGDYKLIAEKQLEGKPRLAGNFRSGEEFSLPLDSLPSGVYNLEYGLSWQGKTIRDNHKIILFSRTDSVCPVDSLDFFYPLSHNTIEFMWGGSRKDSLYACFEIFGADEILHHQIICLPRGLKTFKFDYLPSWPERISYSLYSIADGKEIHHKEEISRPQPCRDLNVTIHQLRTIVPTGNLTNLNLEVSPADTAAGKLNGAELLLSIYDRTADRYGENSLDWKPFIPSRSPYLPSINCPACQQNRSSNRQFVAYGLKSTSNTRIYSNAAPMYDDAVLSETSAVRKMADENLALPDGGDDKEEETQNLRQESPQTLAFLPDLQIDQKGQVTAEFSSGESFGSFIIRVSAHTADLRTGSATESIIVQNPLMTMPSYPQFLRAGDHIFLQAKIVNLSEKTLSGKASLNLSSLGRKLDLVQKSVIDLVLETGAQKEVNWEIIVPDDISVLTLQTLFSCPDGSDGEIRSIPVMSNLQGLCNSTLTVLQKAGNHRIDLAGILPTKPSKDGVLTVEISDPLGAAMGALPFVSRTRCDGLIPNLHSWYATATGGAMLEKYPFLKESIALSADDPDALEVNEDLTGILMSESPWQAYRVDKNRQKRILHLWSDSLYIKDFQIEILKKISALQNSDGGFAWFPQMPSSQWMSLMYLQTIIRLKENGVNIPQDDDIRESSITEKAIGYTDSQIVESWEQDLKMQKKSKKDWEPSLYGPLEYLYVRSAFASVPFAGNSSKAFDYYYKWAQDEWNSLSILQKGRLLTIMLRRGEDCSARIESLSQYAVSNKYIGCYFPNAIPWRGLFSSELEAHCVLLQVFQQAGRDDIVLGIQQWLLLQKENQVWEDDAATCDAINALLLSSGDTQTASKAFLQSPKAEVILKTSSFIRYRVEPNTNGSLPSIKINLPENRVVFVSAFYQYTQKTADSDAFGNGIKISTRWKETLETSNKEDLGKIATLKIKIESDENRSFVILDIQRASTLYPRREISGYMWIPACGGVYREVKESIIRYYFYNLPQGSTTLEEDFLVRAMGESASCLVRIQSQFAPEYRARERY